MARMSQFPSCLAGVLVLWLSAGTPLSAGKEPLQKSGSASSKTTAANPESKKSSPEATRAEATKPEKRTPSTGNKQQQQSTNPRSAPSSSGTTKRSSSQTRSDRSTGKTQDPTTSKTKQSEPSGSRSKISGSSRRTQSKGRKSTRGGTYSGRRPSDSSVSARQEPEKFFAKQAKEVPPNLLSKFTAGQQAFKSGDIRKASDSFQEATKKIRDDEQALSTIQMTASAFRASALKIADLNERKKRVAAAADQYRMMLDRGEPVQGKLLIGRLYLDTAGKGDTKSLQTGLRVIRAIEPDEVEDELKDVYHFNYGRALELNGQKREALVQYEEAIRRDPYFVAPVERSYDVLRSSSVPDVDTTVKLGRTLADAGNGRLALEESLKCLEAKPFAGDSRSVKVLGLVADQMSRSGVTPETWLRDYQKQLLDIAEGDGVDEHVSAAIRQLDGAFEGAFQPFEWGSFSEWSTSTSRAKAMSSILKNAGDHYRARLQRDSAESDRLRVVTSYTMAWALGYENIDAAIYAADALQRYEWDEVDHEGLLNQLVDSLFHGKETAYDALRKSATPRTWADVLRFHSVLGGIYEREGDWGGDPKDVRSAVFQWRYAINAAEKSNQLHLIPGLRERLGVATFRASQTHPRGEVREVMKVESGKQLNESINGSVRLKSPESATHSWLTWTSLDDSVNRNHPFRQSLAPRILDEAGRDVPLPQSAGLIASGPDGVLYYHDFREQRVLAFDLSTARLPRQNGAVPDIPLDDLSARLARVLNVNEPRNVSVVDVTEHPQSGLLILSVNVRNGRPVLVTLGPGKQMRKLDLDSMRRIELCRLPKQSFAYMDLVSVPGHACLPVFRRDRKTPLASLELVSGPAEDPPLPVTVEVFDGRRGAWTSEDNILQVASLSMNGERYVAGCTMQGRWFVIPMVDLRPGQTVRGRPITGLEQGAKAVAADVVAIDGSDAGPPVLAVARRTGGVLLLRLETPDGYLTPSQRLRAGFREAVADGAHRLARIGGRRVVSMRRQQDGRQALLEIRIP